MAQRDEKIRSELASWRPAGPQIELGILDYESSIFPAGLCLLAERYLVLEKE